MTDPVGRDLRADLQPDDVTVRPEGVRDAARHGCTAAQRDDAGAREGVDRRVPLQRPEVLLAVVGEDLPDLEAGAPLDVRVDVDERDAEALGEEASDRGLAGARRADQRNAVGHARPRSARRAAYAAAFLRVSANESPPNFSSAASASTRATIASATTPAAGTAHTSERW